MARTLPIPAEQREITVRVDGAVVSRQEQLLAASVVLSANKIASARLVYLDGSPAQSDFPLSNRDLFKPGARVEISGGKPGEPARLFVGVVVQLSLKIREGGAPCLIVDCRHAAVRLSVGRKSAYWVDRRDDEVISALLEAAGLSAEVAPTRVAQRQLVQYNCTDWDFLLMRAQANGMLVYTHQEAVVVKAPDTSARPSMDLLFGSTVLDLDATIDARTQYSAVRGLTWDPTQQAIVAAESRAPARDGPGNLRTAELAAAMGRPALDLRHPALLEDEAQALADAERRRLDLDRVRGRVRCEGIAVQPGSVVNLLGVGDRFSGPVFVTGVRHEHSASAPWKTHIQFGGIERLSDGPGDIGAARAAGLLPGVHGLSLGVVVGNEDPDGEQRVRVRDPLVSAGDDGTWARVASPEAGADRGFCFRPEVGDEVVLGFLDDDPRQAVILGALHSSAKPAPLAGADANPERRYQSRSGLKLSFLDDSRTVRLETPQGNVLTLSDDEARVRLADQHGNSVELNADGVRIAASKAIVLEAATELHLVSGTSLDVEAGGALGLQGASGAALTSTGVTQVKGSLVHIK